MDILKDAKIAKKDISAMVSGLGMALRLLQSLIEKVEDRGGNAAMIHFLTTPTGEGNLDQIADLIASLKWRVPKSVIMKLAREISISKNEGRYANSDEKFFWEPALRKLGIPFILFAADQPVKHIKEEYRNLHDLRDQLEGKTFESGMILTWNNESYIIAGIDYEEGDPIPGVTIIKTKYIYFLHLTPAEYIDLEN